MPDTPLQWRAPQTVGGSGFDEKHSDIVQLANGNILVVYTASDDDGVGSPAGTDILAQIYDPLGNAVGGLIRLNTIRFGDDEQTPSVAALPGGGFAVTYLDVRVTSAFPTINVDTDVVFQVYDAVGTSLRSGIVKNGTGVGVTDLQTNPKIAALSDTQALIIWEDRDQNVLLRTLNPTTGELGAELAAFTGGAAAGESVRGVSVTALPNSGRYVIAWGNENSAPANDTVQYKTFNPAHDSFTSTVTVSTSLAENFDPSVTVLTNGNIVISWTTDGTGGTDTGVRYRIYNSIGVAQTAALNPATTIAGNQVGTAVAALDNGEFVVFWFDEDTHDLHGQRIDAAGVRIGTEFHVRNFGSTDISGIKATRLEDGRVAVTWTAEFAASDDVEFSIWDPRDVANAPDSNGRVIGTVLADTITVVAGTTEVYGHTGNDRITVDASLVDPATLFDGGAGTDALVIGTEAGHADFRGETVRNFERIEFAHFGASRTASFFAAQLDGVTVFVFDSARGTQENLDIYMSSRTTLDLSGVSVQAMNVTDDGIRIFGDSSVETITGTAFNDVINGAAGNDTLIGGNGNDILVGGIGADRLDGGAGNDTASYVGSGAGVAINLATGAASGGDAAGDVLVSIENVIGSAFNDTLRGSADANMLNGGNGDDVLVAGPGRDSLHGDAGEDRLFAGNGSLDVAGAVFNGGADRDTLVVFIETGAVLEVADFRTSSVLSIEEVEFNTGISTVVRFNAIQFGSGRLATNLMIDGFTAANANDTVVFHLNLQPQIDLSNLTFTDWNVNLLENDQIHVVGNNGINDTIVGTSQRDRLDGGSGDDVLDGGEGGDTLIGGTGRDTVTYARSNAAVSVDLLLGAGLGGHATQDSLQSIENLIGSAFDDTLAGSADHNLLQGGAGRDSLVGGDGNDTLDGGSSADTIYGGSDADSLIGGSNNDLLHGDAFNDTIYGGTGRDTAFGGTGNDLIYGEIGTDVLNGDTGSDTIYGGDDNDTIDGGSSSDTLHGDGGNDSILGGSNNDEMYGGTGNDTILGGTGKDRAYGGEGDDLILGEVGVDVLYGDNGLDTLQGGVENDIIYGGAHNDLIYGEEDDDRLYGDGSSDTIYGGHGNDTIDGGSSADTLHGDEGNDLLLGDSNNDVIFGGTGEDTLMGGTGRDTLYGGTQNDSLMGEIAEDSIHGDDGQDTIYGGDGADSLYGGSHSDLIHGDADNDIIFGDGSEDTVYGGLGDDTIDGGGSADVLYGGDGADSILGNTNNDVISGDNQNDTLLGGTGHDTIFGGSHDDLIYGEAGNDLLFGDGSSDLIYGGDDNDTIEGGGSADTIHGDDGDDFLFGDGNNDVIFGGAGNDTIYGGTGSDTMSGGAGVDVFVFDTVATSTNIDTIEDFNVADDTMLLFSSAFAGLSAGPLAASAFRVNTTGLAQAAGDRVIYNSATGQLFFDNDGTGAGARQQFATVDAGLALTNADFIVL